MIESTILLSFIFLNMGLTCPSHFLFTTTKHSKNHIQKSSGRAQNNSPKYHRNQVNGYRKRDRQSLFLQTQIKVRFTKPRRSVITEKRPIRLSVTRLRSVGNIIYLQSSRSSQSSFRKTSPLRGVQELSLLLSQWIRGRHVVQLERWIRSTLEYKRNSA